MKWRFKRIFKGCFLERFTSVLVERRLRIKRLHLAITTREENPDHAFRFWRVVGFAVRRPPFSFRPDYSPFFCQHGRECQAGESHADVSKESAALDLSALATTLQGLFSHHTLSTTGNSLSVNCNKIVVTE